MNHIKKNIAFFLLFPFCTTIQAAELLGRNRVDNSPPTSLQENHGIDVDKFEKLSLPMEEEIKTARGKEICLFLGPTGVGKSTSINYLKGLTMVREARGSSMRTHSRRQSRRMFIRVSEVDSHKKRAKIGRGKDSCTQWPECFNAGYQGLVLCDFPGIKDTRGIEMQCIASLGSNGVIQQSEKIKAIILLVSKDNLGSAKGAIFMDLLEVLLELLGDTENYMASIYFGFTKAGDWGEDDFLDEIQEEIILLEKRVEEELGMKLDQYWEDIRKAKNMEDIYKFFKKNKRLSIVWQNAKKKRKSFKKRGKRYEELGLRGILFLNTMLRDYESHFFIIDPLNREERIKILKKIKKSVPIEKNQVKFLGTSEVKRKIFLFYTDMSKLGSKKLTSFFRTQREYTEKKQNMQLLRKKVEKKEKEIEKIKEKWDKLKRKNKETIDNELKKINTNEINNEKEEASVIQTKVDLIKNKIREQEKKIKKYNKDEEIKVGVCHTVTKNTGRSKLTKILCSSTYPKVFMEYWWEYTYEFNENIKIDRIEANAWDINERNIHFNMVEVGNEIEYNAKFECLVINSNLETEDKSSCKLKYVINTKNPKLSIQKYAKKKNYYIAEIKTCNENITRMQQKIVTHEKNLAEARKRIQTLLTQETREVLDEQYDYVNSINKKINSERDILDCMKEKERRLERQIDQRKTVFSVIEKTYNFIVQEKGIIKKFVEQYREYANIYTTTINQSNNSAYHDDEEKKENDDY